jgi:hypothetical protein
MYSARSGLQNYRMTPRTLNSLLLVGALLAPTALTPSLAAQRPATIVGQVVVKRSDVPVSYAVVGAKPGAPERFTGSDGQFVLRDLKPGSITLTARHIGYTPLDTTINVVAGDSLNLRIELALITIQLPAVHALAQRCAHPGDANANLSAELAVLFDQVKQNAERNQLLASSYPFEVTIERKITKPEPSLEARFVAYDTVIKTSARTWRYEPGNMLGTREIESGAFGGKWYTIMMPELADFADQRFLENHCFDFGGEDVVDGDTLLRMDFAPAPVVKTADVGGAVFLDPKTYQLRMMHLILVNLPKQLRSQISGQSIIAKFQEPIAGVPVIAKVQSMVIPREDAKGLASEPATEDQRALRVRFLKGKP